MRSLRAILGGYNGKPLRQVGKFKKLGTDPLARMERGHLQILDVNRGHEPISNAQL